jgi:hypothetical protein
VTLTLTAAVVGALALAPPPAVAQSLGLTPSDVAPFVGTWRLEMTNPAGAVETLRVWEEGGAVKTTLQLGRFPPMAATGLLKDGDMLVLTGGRFENGAPIRVVVELTLEGDTMHIAEMLSRSETIKRGSGKKVDDPR